MEICYLLAFPDPDENARQPKEKIKGLKDAPYFEPIDIDVVTIGEENVTVNEYAVSVLRQRYDGRVQMVEARYSLHDPFAASVLPDRGQIQDTLQNRYIPEAIRRNGLFEDYSILLVREAKPVPDQWIEKNNLAIANFIRSQREVFDSEEAEEILASRTHYSAGELTLVDWEGAVIIAPKADFESDVALLKIGNYQILRYRMLNQSIEEMLDKINERFFPKRGRPRPTRGLIRQIAEHRLEVMIDFERSEQNLLLIGDWYTAKLYEVIQNEFYLREWKESVRTKLDNLENIVETMQENFSLSWEALMDRLQLLGWVLLLLGYLYLYVLDAGWVKLP